MLAVKSDPPKNGLLHGVRAFRSFCALDWQGLLFRFHAIRRGSYVEYGCRCMRDGEVVLGSAIVIQRNAVIGVRQGGRLSIGNKTRIGSDLVLSCGERVDIGASVLIAARCFIADYGHAFSDMGQPVMEQGAEAPRAVEIGDGSWLGVNVCIMPGVRLGRHCVVAANSVVTTSFPDFSVIAGAPARLARTLGADRVHDEA
jgi:acetyltransferase-like isoleucine patch superfamily enzyme